MKFNIFAVAALALLPAVAAACPNYRLSGDTYELNGRDLY